MLKYNHLEIMLWYFDELIKAHERGFECLIIVVLACAAP